MFSIAVISRYTLSYIHSKEVTCSQQSRALQLEHGFGILVAKHLTEDWLTLLQK